jgi:hypothetical protein
MAEESKMPVSDTEIELPERRRTVLIWLIFVGACFTVLDTVTSLVIALSGIELGQPKVTPISRTINVVDSVAFFLGGLAIFNLCANAVRWFGISLALNVAAAIYAATVVIPDITYSTEVPGVPQSMLFGVIFGLDLLILVGTFAYAVWLRRKRVLT